MKATIAALLLCLTLSGCKWWLFPGGSLTTAPVRAILQGDDNANSGE